ncbi:hypothetical protein [Rufibacter hautae]|uniref:Uncharacterized protein n=1 Tax=Rufibacter hautae TaxID=2595005 RepID=A0A5B6TDL5_9BACT|nr:hypothetical protein [Rufibacter hautae]KAA3437069.1 hypothetical protein FOA19_22120 [Rufibacter hautae]
MKSCTYTKLASAILILVFPLVSGCAILPGGGYSNDPIVAEQQRQIESLKAELDRAEQDTNDAKQREKAAKSRLKAAQDELKVMQTEAKRRAS